MSTPAKLDGHETPDQRLEMALGEIISAMSALNMPAEPIALPPNSDPDRIVYLSESDAWAKHAMEHLMAAFNILIGNK